MRKPSGSPQYRAPQTPTDEYPLQTVTLTLCSACLDGVGGECHTPGCALWLSVAPDIPIRDKVQTS